LTFAGVLSVRFSKPTVSDEVTKELFDFRRHPDQDCFEHDPLVWLVL
jgi:hypothetical protein